MKLVLQRVSRAEVRVDGAPFASIGRGLLILAGVGIADSEASVDAAVAKVKGLRLFDDAAGKTNLSCEDVGGEFLVVSQFTLQADLSRGKRPGFDDAMKPPRSRELYERFCAGLAAATGRPVNTGSFGASMQVELVNDGPATYVLEVR